MATTTFENWIKKSSSVSYWCNGQQWKRFSRIRMRKRERMKARKIVWSETNVIFVNCCRAGCKRQNKNPSTNERRDWTFFFLLLSFANLHLKYSYILHSTVPLFFFCSSSVVFPWLRYFQWDFDIAHKLFCFDINLTSFCGCKTSSCCLLMSPLIFHSILAQSLSRIQWTQEKFIIFFFARLSFWWIYCVHFILQHSDFSLLNASNKWWQ